MFKRILLLGLIAAIALAACQAQKGSAKDMLPDVPNTTVVEGQTITQFVAKAADGAALATANPQLIPLVQRVEASLTCYQDLGAVALRTYTDKTFPLSAGVVAIIDRKALTDPTNFANCVLGRAQDWPSGEMGGRAHGEHPERLPRPRQRQRQLESGHGISHVL